jgi:starch synthase
MPLKICFATAEVEPLAKAGGLADVSAALVKYLHADGHDIRLFVPAYADIRREELELFPVQFLQQVPLYLGSFRYEFSVLTTRLPGSQASIYLIDCPACYARPGIYTSDPDEHRRFLVLTHAAFLCCQRMGFAPQILHFNDWHTAIGALLRRTSYGWDGLFRHARTVVTIHNMGYQGVIGAASLPELLTPSQAQLLDPAELAAGRVNLLRTGLQYADLITTVSPTYAREIQSPEYGMGLDGLLRARSASLLGILNGVDYEVWDPRRDRFLPRRYGSNQLGVKASLKEEFQQRLGLNGSGRCALIGIVTRLAVQKGVDLLYESLPQLLAARPFNLVVLGSGEWAYEQFFADLQQSFPDRVHFHRGYSEELAHWIEAASDMFLMPSRYEPCGLNLMYSLRYGTVPIVRRTGGLADSVQHFDVATGLGTGVVFNDYNVDAVSWAIGTALDWFDNRGLWHRLVQNGMAQSFSWSRQVQQYVAAYDRLLQG